MQDLQTITDFVSLNGQWRRLSDRLVVTKRQQSVIFRPGQEPGFVIWCVGWQEPDGALKLTFTEVTGDLTSWPPSYDFNQCHVEMRRRILVSRDLGRSWQDTGHGCDAKCSEWRVNCDAGYQNMIRLADGRLLRSARGYSKTRTGMTSFLVYDQKKAQESGRFPFTGKPGEMAAIYPCFLASSDEGNSWQELSRIESEIPFYFTGFHQLKNGLIVATGAMTDKPFPDGYKAVIADSSDGGSTWSQPQIFAVNNEVCRGLCEESDFVEMEDGTLLLINRVVKEDGTNVLFHLQRRSDGHWTVLSESCPKNFIRTGYPAMLRASDGTIFHDRASSLLYSCDDGASWEVLPLAYTYYGRLLEAAPRRILNITQNNIGDAPFPWWYDTDIRQNAFEYRRYRRFAQEDQRGGCLVLSADVLSAFHLCVLADFEEKVQFLWGQDENNGCFAQVECRNGKALFFTMGKLTAGVQETLRSYCVAPKKADSSVEIQLDCTLGRLQAAVKLNDGDWSSGQNPPCYLAMVTESQKRGKLFGKMTGVGKVADLHIAYQGGISIRENWQNSPDGSSAIELDAGRKY